MNTDPNSVYQSFLKPENTLAKALHLMGIESFGANLLETALDNIAKALAIQPNEPQYLYNYALVLKNLNRHHEALAAINQSLAIDPQSANSHSLLGNILQELREFSAAIDCYNQAIAIEPKFADAYNNRAFAYKELREFAQASKDFEKALALDENYPLALGNLIHTKMLNCDWENLDLLLNKLFSEIEAGKKVANPFPFLALNDSASIQQKVANIHALTYPENNILGHPPSSRNIDKTNKIRVGYFSADVHNHATMYLIAGMLEMHNKEQFEIHAFSFGADLQDEMRMRCVNAVDHFHNVSAMSDGVIAQMARDLHIDIAVDLKGYTQDGRPGIFAFRAAPKQISYLGYPGTLGSRYMDYLIADAVLIPESSKAYYSEEILYLPHSYQANDRKRLIPPPPPSRKFLNLPEQGFVYCSFNNNYKITPKMFAAWMRILQNTPNSVLWLLEDSLEASKNLQRVAREHGIDPNRLIFAKRAPHAEHLFRLQAADLFLDTFPFNAHTTASDALWVGLPILTRAGESFASRVAASLLNAVDLPQLVCETEAQYIENAIALANHPGKLSDIKNHLLKKRYSLPLFNTNQFIGDLEGLYKKVFSASKA